jgi:hypothetical protein
VSGFLHGQVGRITKPWIFFCVQRVLNNQVEMINIRFKVRLLLVRLPRSYGKEPDRQIQQLQRTVGALAVQKK